VGALVALAPACGSGDEGGSAETGTSPSVAWADALCGALTRWQDSLQSVGTKLKDGGLSREALRESATTVASANHQLVADVHALGSPPRSAGPEARAAVSELSKQLEDSAEKIRGSTQSVSSAKDVVTAVNDASAELLAMSADVSATVSTLKSLDAAETWRQAFQDSEACRSLQKR
jgi:methyl-accepting chemotaxis protein